MIDPKSKRAYGVEYEKFGKRHTVLARREVIISAGAIKSPHLLLLSGVGSKKHLQDKGIFLKLFHNGNLIPIIESTRK